MKTKLTLSIIFTLIAHLLIIGSAYAWPDVESLDTARYFHTSTLLPDGRVLVVGGTSATETAKLTSNDAAPPSINLVWGDGCQNSIYRANLDGSSPSVLVDEANIPLSSTGSAGSFSQNGVAVDGNYIYWADNYQDSIYRANRDGSSPMVLVDEANIPLSSTGTAGSFALRGVAVGGNYVYWADVYQDSIYRANLDGSSPTVLVDEANIPLSSTGSAGSFEQNGVAVDGSYIYWGDSSQDSIYRANLDGSSPTVLVDEANIPLSSTGAPGIINPTGMAVDGSYIYWGDSSQDSIYRANRDGSSPTVLVDEANIPLSSTGTAGSFIQVGVAVESSYIYWVDSSQDSIYRVNLDGSSPTVLVDEVDIPISSTGTAGNLCLWGIAVVQATCINSAQNGLWANGTTWAGGTEPTGTDGACINADHTVTLGADTAADWLQVNSGGTLDLASYSLTIENGIDNYGTIQQTQNVGASSTVNFVQIRDSGDTTDQYRGLDIGTGVGVNLGSTTVQVMGDTAICNNNDGGTYRDRCFMANPANSGSATVTLYSTAAEDDIADDAFFQYDFGTTWTEGTACNDAVGGGGTCMGTATFASPAWFLIGSSSSNPTAVQLQDFSASEGTQFLAGTAFLITLLALGGLFIWQRRRAN